MLFRPAEWYEEQQIESLTRVSAMKLDHRGPDGQLSNKQVDQLRQGAARDGRQRERG